MCKAFSCVALESGRVLWQFGVDSHEDLLAAEKLADMDIQPNFARVEIPPRNGDYQKPDKWVLKIDEQATPAWWSPAYEAACWDAHKDWCRQLYAILDTESVIISPFTLTPPTIGKKHIALLRKWASVRASVGASVRASVWASVWDSVGDSVWDSVGDSVWASVGASVRASVWASVGAQIGSLFRLPRAAWKNTNKIKTKGYPFQPAVDLWRLGLVPSFDGTTWHLHGGPSGLALFSITQVKLRGVK